MGIFPVLGMERKYERQIQLCGLARRGLPEENRVVRMDDIKLERRKQLVYKWRNRDGRRDISQRKRQARIAENERFGIIVCTIGLRKDKYVVPLFHQVFTERCYRPHNSIDHWVIVICKESDVQSLLRRFVKKSR